MKRATWISIALLIMLVTSANAEERKYRFEFFGQGAYPLKKEFVITVPQSLTPVPGTQRFSAGGGGGVRIGIDGAKYWGQDYLYSYNSNASKIATSNSDFAFNNRFHQVSANVLFYPSSLEHKTTFPYLTAGVGATFVTISQKTIGEALAQGVGPLKGEVIFAFNAGAGIRWRVNNRWGIRLDLRDYMSRPLRYGLPESSSDPSAPVLPVSGAFHNLVGSFGIVIHF
jgi:opacity protein-like surface antigen